MIPIYLEIVPYAHHYNLQFVYFFTHFLKVKNVFSSSFFPQILPLCMVSIQQQFVIQSRLSWIVRYVDF